MKIIIRSVKGKKYHYLEHSYRLNNKVKKVSKYLGREVPNDLERIKKELFEELDFKRWIKSCNSIKKKFNSEFIKYPKSAKEKYYNNFQIKFTYNTNKIEGNTLTLKETIRLLEEGIMPSKSKKDINEIESHKKLFQTMITEKEDLSIKLILKWHKLLFENVDSEIAGIIRKHPVGIYGSKFEPPSPSELTYLLREFIIWYHNHKNKIHPVILAGLIHLKFVTIHPFSDGNGRISRILMNFILHRNGFPMVDIDYSKRNNYYNALERSQVKEEKRIFISYLIKRYLKEYKRHI